MAKKMANQPYDPIEAEWQRILTGRLNQLCKEENLTWKELSQKSGVSLSTIRRIAQEKHCNISSDTMLKLCKAFKIAPYQLFDETLLETENR